MSDDERKGDAMNLVATDDAWVDAMWDRMCGAAKTLAEAQLDVLVHLLKARFPSGNVVHLVAKPEDEAVRVSRVLTSAARDLYDPEKDDLGPHAFLIEGMLGALGASPQQYLNPYDDWADNDSWVYVFELPGALPTPLRGDRQAVLELSRISRIRRRFWRAVWYAAWKQLARGDRKGSAARA